MIRRRCRRFGRFVLPSPRLQFCTELDVKAELERLRRER
jgi:hypothetical protein